MWSLTLNEKTAEATAAFWTVKFIANVYVDSLGRPEMFWSMTVMGVYHMVKGEMAAASRDAVLLCDKPWFGRFLRPSASRALRFFE